VGDDRLLGQQRRARALGDLAAEFAQVLADEDGQARTGERPVHPLPVLRRGHQNEDAFVAHCFPPSGSISAFPTYCGTPVITPRNSRSGSPTATPCPEIWS